MSSILQSKQWADFKATQGFEIIKVDNLFVHKRTLPLNNNFLYVPEASSADISGSQVDDLKSLAKKEQSVFLRLEMVDRFGDNARKILMSMGFEPSFEQVQPKWRQIINLTQTRGAILAQMKQKGRYNIKLSERRGVKVSRVVLNGKDPGQDTALRTFFDIYRKTVEREKITGRSFEYFEKMAVAFADTPYLKIYIATCDNKPLAASLISTYDKVASYLYGGSSNEMREVMAPYLIHWQAMIDAKDEECIVYDLIGRSKPGDEGSSWAGLSKFKEQFGGEAVEILGSFDFINKALPYKIFKLLEKARRK